MRERGDQDVLDVTGNDVDRKYKKNVASIWLDRIRIFVAEFIGTALLIYITCMGCTTGMFGENVPLVQKSLASGLSVMTAIQIFGHISGAHVNPAVTLCAVIMGEVPVSVVPVYVVSQIAGSVTGYALLMALTPHRFLDVQGHCSTALNPDITQLQAVAVEFIATFIMILAICAAWDPRNRGRGDSVPLKIGLLVFLLNISAGAYSGASMNPVRSFGPIVFNHYLWYTHWIYWVGPSVGAALAAYSYKALFLEKPLGF